ncbi:MAG: RpiB/LacA/LacB family sugar-phosphate isomerase [Candidatus Micrarchaeota archaeon]
MSRILIASDHAGFKLKNALAGLLEKKGYAVEDLGVDSDAEKVDYPDFSFKLGEKVAKENAQGVLVCGTGAGVAIAANKVKGVRAAQAYDIQSARDAKIHNNANVITLSGYRFTAEQALELVEAWLSSEFENEERRTRRVRKITDYENR